MAVYLIMTAMSVVLAMYAQKFYKKAHGGDDIETKDAKDFKWIIFAVLAVLPTLLVSGLRYYVGTDYATYLRDTGYIGSVFKGEPAKMEWGYRLLVELAALVDSKQLVFFVSAVIFSVFIFLFVYKSSDNWAFSVLLILLTGAFTQSLNIMRQMMAIAICMYAIKYAVEKNFKMYLLFVVLAAFIHSIVIIFIPLYFLTYVKKIDNRILLAIVVLAKLGSPLVDKIMFELLTLLKTDYALYFDSSRDSGASFVLTVMSLFILVLCMFFDKKEDKRNTFMIYYQTLACIMLALSLPNANRIAYLFIPVQIALVPNIIETISNIKLKRLITAGTIFAYTGFWLYYFYWINVSATFPYKSVFSM